MKLEQVECGNKAYTPRSVDLSDVEGASYVHIIVELPNERRVPRMAGTERSFFVWRPDGESPWMPMPAGEIDRLNALCFDKRVPPCESDDEQAQLIEDMILMIDGDAVVVAL